MDDALLVARGDLRRMVLALQPASGHLVLCGGWAAYAYQWLDEFEGKTVPSIPTTDIDWAVPAALPPDVPEIASALRAHGFVGVFSSSQHPPVTVYQDERFGTEAPGEVYAEFLAPLRGSEQTVTARPQPGLSATLLRYMDLALHEPVSIDFGRSDLGLPAGTQVRVAHPGNFLVHKALVASLPERPRDQRDKDLAYIYEVVVRSRSRWPWVAERIAALRAHSHEYDRWVEQAEERLAGWFTRVEDVGPAAVSAVLATHFPTPVSLEQIHVQMKMGLSALGLSRSSTRA